MKTSAAGLALLKQFEGFAQRAYEDIGGVWTIGYGHAIHPDEAPLRYETITEADAEDLLAHDAQTAERVVEACLPNWQDALHQEKFDALVCLCYNIGGMNFKKSSLVKVLNQNFPRAYVSTAWRKWSYVGKKFVPGLLRRRNLELALFYSEEDAVLCETIVSSSDSKTPSLSRPLIENTARQTCFFLRVTSSTTSI